MRLAMIAFCCISTLAFTALSAEEKTALPPEPEGILKLIKDQGKEVENLFLAKNKEGLVKLYAAGELQLPSRADKVEYETGRGKDFYLSYIPDPENPANHAETLLTFDSEHGGNRGENAMDVMVQRAMKAYDDERAERLHCFQVGLKSAEHWEFLCSRIAARITSKELIKKTQANLERTRAKARTFKHWLSLEGAKD